MKRFFFLTVAATALFAACNKTEVVPTGEVQEISFVAVNKVATKVPVDGTAFQNYDNMAIAAYIVEGTTPNDFFGYTFFERNSKNLWSGKPARYWPLTTSKINFLAVTENGGNVDNTTVEFNPDENYASAATVTLVNNAASDQNDLMFAAGQGIHTQGGAYNAVPMVFKHALAWVNFTVKTSTPAVDNATNKGCTIQVNSITLNTAVFDGTLTLTNPQFNTTGTVTTDNVVAKWTCAAPTSIKVPNADGSGNATPVVLDAAAKPFGNGLLVVPDGYAGSFTINYTLTQADGTANTYDYTYNLPAGKWEMAKKYFYNINITLTEIEVTPSITDWVETSTSTDVELNGSADTPANN